MKTEIIYSNPSEIELGRYRTHNAIFYLAQECINFWFKTRISTILGQWDKTKKESKKILKPIKYELQSIKWNRTQDAIETEIQQLLKYYSYKEALVIPFNSNNLTPPSPWFDTSNKNIDRSQTYWVTLTKE